MQNGEVQGVSSLVIDSASHGSTNRTKLQARRYVIRRRHPDDRAVEVGAARRDDIHQLMRALIHLSGAVCSARPVVNYKQRRIQNLAPVYVVSVWRVE